MDKQQYNLSPIGLVLGIVMGMIIMLVLLTIFYSTRTLIFEICPTANKPCLGGDYYNTPSEAVGDGYDIKENIFIKDDKLHFKKILKSNSCNPETNQVNLINYPQYCEFSIPGLTGRYMGKNNHYGSDTYVIPMQNGGNYVIETYPHCVPKDSSVATDGKPVLKWEK